MAKTYAELSREIEALKVQAEATRQKEKAGVVDRIREAIAVYGLTAEELGFGRKATEAKDSKAAVSTTERSSRASDKAASTTADMPAKYRDASGNTWGGRGPKPNWLKAELAGGRSLESFAMSGLSVDELPAPKRGIEGSRTKRETEDGSHAKKSFKSVVKYRDDAGHTWSGRGPKPAWFAFAIESGKTPEQLAA